MSRNRHQPAAGEERKESTPDARPGNGELREEIDGASKPAVEPGSMEQERDLQALETEIEALTSQLDQSQDRYLRTAAEYQNYRRRTEQERVALADFARAEVILEMLVVYDDLERTVEAAGEVPVEGCEALRAGVDLVYRKFGEALKRLGVEPIEAVGKEFHEGEHEAVMQQPGPEGTAPGTVLTEFQKGYRMGDRVIRHSKVVVSV